MAQFTQREYLFLDDLLHLEELQVAQMADLASHSSDPQIRQLCLDIARRDQQHFSSLLNHLNQGQGKPQGQSSQFNQGQMGQNQMNQSQANQGSYAQTTSGVGFGQ